MDKCEFQAIADLQLIDGISFPRTLKRKRLVITGPPGSGKTTLVKAVNGWPEEAYVDLSNPEWWRAPSLNNRPSEIHFGLPFVGFEEAVSVYATDKLDEGQLLEIDFSRIAIPPQKAELFSTNYYDRFTFDFSVPPAEETYTKRKARAEAGSHPLDIGISLRKVELERNFYLQIADYFQRSGIDLYVRTEITGPPQKLIQQFLTDASALVKEGPEDELDWNLLQERLQNRIWGSHSNRKLLELYVDLIPPALGVERCSIFINDPERNETWMNVGTGIEEGEIRLSIENSLVGRVIERGKSLTLENMQQIEGVHQQIDAKTGFITHNELCVPIKSLLDEETHGAIMVLNKQNQTPFTEADQALLQRVAMQIQAATETIFLRQKFLGYSEGLKRRTHKFRWYRRVIIALSLLIALQMAFISYLLET